MRFFVTIALIVVTGLAAGGALAWYSVQDNRGFGALKVGAWTAWPLAGDAGADPYTKAKVAAEGEVPLGAAEGLTFFARQDDSGKPLKRQCSYLISGNTPPARLWTLTAYNRSGEALRSTAGRFRQLVSDAVIRAEDGTFSLHVGPVPFPGNWLQVDGDGDYQLLMRLYDTPVTGTSGIVDPRMPNIAMKECEG